MRPMLKVGDEVPAGALALWIPGKQTAWYAFYESRPTGDCEGYEESMVTIFKASLPKDAKRRYVPYMVEEISYHGPREKPPLWSRDIMAHMPDADLAIFAYTTGLGGLGQDARRILAER